MPIVVRSRQAAIDLAEIARYIANDDPIAAHRWLEEMHELFALIATQPAIGEEMTSSRLFFALTSLITKSFRTESRCCVWCMERETSEV